MQTNPTIRQFEARDQQAVIDLWVQCGLVVPWNDPAKDIQRKLNAGSDLFLVAALGDLIVGSVMGGYDGHRGWINYLAVSPGHRRKGIGRKLMEAVELGLKAQGCPKINLQIRESNREVAAFYEAMGYTEDQVISLGKRLVFDDKD